VLQCFARLIDPYYLGSKLGITDLQNHGALCTGLDVTSAPQVDKHVQEIDLRHINPAADFTHVVKLMQKGTADVVHPYYFQAILAAKGGENGKEFASGEGAYPYCWFRFTLNSLCEGASFNGHSGIVSHSVIDKLCKVCSAFATVCNACLHEELQEDVLDATDWGLRLDPKETLVSSPDQSPVTIQELLNAHREHTEAKSEQCVNCKKATGKYCIWKGLRKAPKILPIEIKTYERELSANKKTRYKFLFSDIVLNRRIHVPNVDSGHITRYELQAVVKLEGKGHEHAVAFVRSGKHRWWKCSDEDITCSTWEAAQRTHGEEQVSLVFYRKV
jgi:hypothetical protein